jgi:hypothetical protein
MRESQYTPAQSLRLVAYDCEEQHGPTWWADRCNRGADALDQLTTENEHLKREIRRLNNALRHLRENRRVDSGEAQP